MIPCLEVARSQRNKMQKSHFRKDIEEKGKQTKQHIFLFTRFAELSNETTSTLAFKGAFVIDTNATIEAHIWTTTFVDIFQCDGKWRKKEWAEFFI